MSNPLCRRTGKHKHASKGAAEAHLRAMLKLGDITDSNKDLLCTYICSGDFSCGGWHVGKNEFRKPVEIIPVLPKLRRSVGMRYKKD